MLRRAARSILVLAAAGTLFGGAAHAAPATTSCTPAPEWGATRADLAARVVELVNAHRATLGLASLRVSATLTRSAEWKSLHMAGNGYFGHSDQGPPVTRSFFQRVTDCGYGGGGAGENIAYGYPTPEVVMTGWLASPGHRANIENASFRAIGVGVAAKGAGPLFWTQNFGTAADAAPEAAGPAPAPQTPSPATAAAAELGIAFFSAFRSSRTTFAAAVGVVRRDTGAAVAAGGVKCVARVGARHLRVTVNAFRGPVAVCAWRVPAWAAGKLVRGEIRVRTGGAAAARTFTRRAR